jgi:hypothetical protein
LASLIDAERQRWRTVGVLAIDDIVSEELSTRGCRCNAQAVIGNQLKQGVQSMTNDPIRKMTVSFTVSSSHGRNMDSISSVAHLSQ